MRGSPACLPRSAATSHRCPACPRCVTDAARSSNRARSCTGWGPPSTTPPAKRSARKRHRLFKASERLQRHRPSAALGSRRQRLGPGVVPVGPLDPRPRAHHRPPGPLRRGFTTPPSGASSATAIGWRPSVANWRSSRRSASCRAVYTVTSDDEGNLLRSAAEASEAKGLLTRFVDGSVASVPGENPKGASERGRIQNGAPAADRSLGPQIARPATIPERPQAGEQGPTRPVRRGPPAGVIACNGLRCSREQARQIQVRRVLRSQVDRENSHGSRRSSVSRRSTTPSNPANSDWNDRSMPTRRASRFEPIAPASSNGPNCA